MAAGGERKNTNHQHFLESTGENTFDIMSFFEEKCLFRFFTEGKKCQYVDFSAEKSFRRKFFE